MESEARPFTFTLANQIFYNGYGTVQIFFFISGFLLAYTQQNRRPNSLPNLFTFSLRRYLQLSIPMVALIACQFLWPVFLSDGPMFTKISDTLIKNCRDKWWKNVALINNYDPLEDLCLLHTWFLGADFQMHVLGYPLLLAASTAVPMLSLGTLNGFLSIVALAIPGYLTWTHRIPPTLNPMNEARMSDYNIHSALIYYPFYNHWLSYLVGFSLAIGLARYVQRQKIKNKVGDILKFGAPMPLKEQFGLMLLTGACFMVSLSAIFVSVVWADQPAQLDDNWLPYNSAYRALFPLVFVSGVAWTAALCVLYPNSKCLR